MLGFQEVVSGRLVLKFVVNGRFNWWEVDSQNWEWEVVPPQKKKVHVWGNSRLPAPGLGLGNFINYPGVVVNNLRLVAKHQGTWLIEAIFSTT